jgi:hypothetical protein
MHVVVLFCIAVSQEVETIPDAVFVETIVVNDPVVSLMPMYVQSIILILHPLHTLLHADTVISLIPHTNVREFATTQLAHSTLSAITCLRAQHLDNGRVIA